MGKDSLDFDISTAQYNLVVRIRCTLKKAMAEIDVIGVYIQCYAQMAQRKKITVDKKVRLTTNNES